MLYDLSKIFWIFGQPSNLLVILLLLGAVGLALGRRRARAFVGFIALIYLAIAVLPAGQWAITPLEDRFPQPALPPHVDGIILLGGAVNVATTEAHDQVALNRFAERVTQTDMLARRYPDARLVISGGLTGRVSADLTEAKVMRRALVELGLDDSHMLLEEHSRNTYENAVDSAALAKPQPGQVWLLVTSAFHMPRAVGCFRAAGFDVLPFPVDYQTDAAPALGFSFLGEARVLDLALHEWVGLAVYRLLGRTNALFPGPAPLAGRR